MSAPPLAKCFADQFEAEGLTVLGFFKDNEPVSTVHTGDTIAVVLDATPFYAESGGQVGDTGFLQGDNGRIRITDTQKTAEDIFVHYGVVEGGELKAGEEVVGEIDVDRRMAVMRNHTATHLLQGVLKSVVGQHVTQQGSYVGPEYLRFDFTNPEALTAQQLTDIEKLVNLQILENVVVETRTMPLDEARQTGAIAPFGEKYGAEVRVVSIADCDVEFCGGTHMLMTGGIGAFVVTGESAIAAGVRRLEAVTGYGAIDYVQKQKGVLRELSETLSVARDRVPERVVSLLEELRAARKQIAQMQAKASAAAGASLLDEAPVHGGVKVVAHEFPEMSAQQLREAYDALKARQGNGLAVALASTFEGKVTLLVALSPDVVARGLSAGDLVKKVAPVVGGSGGGKKELAQAGGKNPEKIGEALQAALKLISKALG